MRPDQIAVQLYTLRELTAKDLPGTLRAVSAAGYRAVEVAGLRLDPSTRRVSRGDVELKLGPTESMVTGISTIPSSVLS